MGKISFIIHGEPKGKGRPRFRNMGKFVQTYTDKDTAKYENLVRITYLNAYNEMAFTSEDSVGLRLNIYQSIPKSTSKKKKALMVSKEILPTKKPDVDNVVKSVLDGLNKVAFPDDSQIVVLEARKYYSEEPRVEVELWKEN